MAHLICHLIDANVDTAYFRSIARLHDRTRFPVMIGSIAPPGPLQEVMASQFKTVAFSLHAAKRLQYPLALFRLVRLLKRTRASILHAHCFDPTALGLVGARLAGIPFVYTRHHSDHNLRLGKVWHTRVDAFCGRRADQVIAVSAATKAIMTAVEHVSARRITVVHNGIEPLLPAAPEKVNCVRAELNLNGAPVILMVARLHEEKGHRYLFDALPIVQRRHPGVTVLLAGDGPLRLHLMQELKTRELENAVRFLGRRDDIPALLDLATVVVLPSLAESFGFVVLEAMSLGKPVVASRTGGIPEIVSDGESGLLIPQKDSEKLAAAISRILDSPQLALQLGVAARARASAFTFEQMIRGYEHVYERCLAHTL